MNNFTVPYPDYLGKAFAIAGLALVAPACYFFRMYSRVLDYVQMIYVFSLVFAADASLFSNRLSWAFLKTIMHSPNRPLKAISAHSKPPSLNQQRRP